MFSLAPVASGFVSTLNHKRRQACPFGFLVNQPKADASLSEEAAPVWLVNAQVTIQFHGMRTNPGTVLGVTIWGYLQGHGPRFEGS